MALKRFEKADTEELDYTIEWDDWLTGAEIISTSTWGIEPNDTLVEISGASSISGDGLSTIGWFDEGTIGTTYTITNTIVTNSTPPRKGSRSFLLTILETRYLEQA